MIKTKKKQKHMKEIFEITLGRKKKLEKKNSVTSAFPTHPKKSGTKRVALSTISYENNTESYMCNFRQGSTYEAIIVTTVLFLLIRITSRRGDNAREPTDQNMVIIVTFHASTNTSP